MKETIKALFTGKIYPLEQCNIQDEEFLKLRKKLSEKRQVLLKKVDSNLLEEYDNLVSELNFYFCQHHFCQGFETGMKLTVEAIK